tara:strand:+ start:1116 stop:1904 length:789 start_codon:yes stop_codon:yes gene_type:complete
VASRPLFFERLPVDIDLSFLNIQNETRKLISINEEIDVGAPQEILWERLLFILSYVGKAPLANFCDSMRYNGETLVFSNFFSKIAEVSFDACYYFGDNNCYRLIDQREVDKGNYVCYDWIAFNSGGKHNIDYIKTDDGLAREIWFYPSERIDGKTKVKDACVVSYLTDSQLMDFDYSETMARFKMLHEMKERGMRGLQNGFNSAGNPRHYKFKTSHMKREIKENEILKEYKDHIQIPEIAIQDLYKDLRSATLSYDRFLRHL